VNFVLSPWPILKTNCAKLFSSFNAETAIFQRDAESFNEAPNFRLWNHALFSTWPSTQEILQVFCPGAKACSESINSSNAASFHVEKLLLLKIFPSRSHFLRKQFALLYSIIYLCVRTHTGTLCVCGPKA
jgi:hypothetical protein